MVVMSNIMEDICGEADRAATKYGPPHSTHESLGVLIEEFDELREAIHMNKLESIQHEAIQIAAVAYRLALACSRREEQFVIRSNLS